MMSLALLTLAALSHAAEYRHPRVIELEEKLSADATRFLQGRFPDKPFLVTVEASPIHRAQETGSTERLPYLETDMPQPKDEWDNPGVSLQELMSRVSKFRVQVQVPEDVPEAEGKEIQGYLFLVLHLDRTRDEVKIQRKPWAKERATTTPVEDYWPLVGGLAASIAVVALVSLFLLILANRGVATRIATAVKEAGAAAAEAASAASAPAAAAGGGSGSRGEDKGVKGDGVLKTEDPLKIREVVVSSMQRLILSPAFPNLADLVLIDEHGRADPGGLGSILLEFPESTRNLLFSLSTGSHWLEALTYPKRISSEQLSLLQSLMLNPRDEKRMEFERLLILVWRLGDQALEYMRSVKADEAYQILTSMPRGLAVRIARIAYPDKWVSLLDSEAAKTVDIPPERIAELQKLATDLKPLNKPSDIARYKNDLNLLDFLRDVDLKQEREIYEAAPKTSIIHKIRPPFYKVLDLPESVLRDVLEKFKPDQAAMALFGADRALVDRLVPLLNEKFRYVFEDKLEFFGERPPSKERLGVIRAKIALLADEIVASVSRGDGTAAAIQREEAKRAA